MYIDTHCGEAQRYRRSVMGDCVARAIAATRAFNASWNEATCSYNVGAYDTLTASMAGNRAAARTVEYLRG